MAPPCREAGAEFAQAAYSTLTASPPLSSWPWLMRMKIKQELKRIWRNEWGLSNKVGLQIFQS